MKVSCGDYGIIVYDGTMHDVVVTGVSSGRLTVKLSGTTGREVEVPANDFIGRGRDYYASIPDLALGMYCKSAARIADKDDAMKVVRSTTLPNGSKRYDKDDMVAFASAYGPRAEAIVWRVGRASWGDVKSASQLYAEAAAGDRVRVFKSDLYNLNDKVFVSGLFCGPFMNLRLGVKFVLPDLSNLGYESAGLAMTDEEAQLASKVLAASGVEVIVGRC